jgi:hypothetical protein
MTEREPDASTHHPVKKANLLVCAAYLVRWPCRAVHELILNGAPTGPARTVRDRTHRLALNERT